MRIGPYAEESSNVGQTFKMHNIGPMLRHLTVIVAEADQVRHLNLGDKRHGDRPRRKYSFIRFIHSVRPLLALHSAHPALTHLRPQQQAAVSSIFGRVPTRRCASHNIRQQITTIQAALSNGPSAKIEVIVKISDSVYSSPR